MIFPASLHAARAVLWITRGNRLSALIPRANIERSQWNGFFFYINSSAFEVTKLRMMALEQPWKYARKRIFIFPKSIIIIKHFECDSNATIPELSYCKGSRVTVRKLFHQTPSKWKISIKSYLLVCFLQY